MSCYERHLITGSLCKTQTICKHSLQAVQMFLAIAIVTVQWDSTELKEKEDQSVQLTHLVCFFSSNFIVSKVYILYDWGKIQKVAYMYATGKVFWTFFLVSCAWDLNYNIAKTLNWHLVNQPDGQAPVLSISLVKQTAWCSQFAPCGWLASQFDTLYTFMHINCLLIKNQLCVFPNSLMLDAFVIKYSVNRCNIGVKRIVSTKTKQSALKKSEKSKFFQKLVVKLGVNKTSVKYWKKLLKIRKLLSDYSICIEVLAEFYKNWNCNHTWCIMGVVYARKTGIPVSRFECNHKALALSRGLVNELYMV